MDLTWAIIDDMDNISHEDLSSKYNDLYKYYKELESFSEENAQKKYSLKRKLELVKASKKYLTDEIEEFYEKDYPNMQKELDELNKNYTKLNVSYKSLSTKCEILTEENDEMRQQLEQYSQETIANRNCSTTTQKQNNNVQSSAFSDQRKILENENDKLLQKLSDYEDIMTKLNEDIADCKREEDILKEQVNCLEENVKHSQNEIKEKDELLEELRMELREIIAKMPPVEPADENRKGNSLFAQVYDQKVALEKIYLAQQKVYIEKKKLFMESEDIKRQLKCENSSIIDELKKCATVFIKTKNDKAPTEDRLHERIKQLLHDREQLEDKIHIAEDSLKKVSIEKKILCVDIFLDVWKRETRELKERLRNTGSENYSLEIQIYNALQEAAEWHFECLISHYTMARYENTLDENHITYKALSPSEIHLDETEVKNAKPIISLESIGYDISKAITSTENENDEKHNNNENDVISTKLNNLTINPDKVVENELDPLPKDISTVQEAEPTSTVATKTEMNNEEENFVATKKDLATLIENELQSEVSPLKIKTCAPPGRSILKKSQCNFEHFNKNNRNVKFSEALAVYSPSPTVNYCEASSSSLTSSDSVVAPVKSTTITPSGEASALPSSSSSSSSSPPPPNKECNPNKSKLKIRRIFIRSKRTEPFT